MIKLLTFALLLSTPAVFAQVEIIAIDGVEIRVQEANDTLTITANTFVLGLYPRNLKYVRKDSATFRVATATEIYLMGRAGRILGRVKKQDL